jgi:hypothetical protein
LTARAKHVESQAELAAMAGVSVTTWKAHVAQGAPTPKSRADLPAWAKRYHAWRALNGKIAGAPRPTREADPARRELTQLRSRHLRVAIAEKQGHLLRRTDVVDGVNRAILGVKNGHSIAQQRIAARLGPITLGGEIAVEDVVAQEFEILCDELASGAYVSHVEAAASRREVP